METKTFNPFIRDSYALDEVMALQFTINSKMKEKPKESYERENLLLRISEDLEEMITEKQIDPWSVKHAFLYLQKKFPGWEKTYYAKHVAINEVHPPSEPEHPLLETLKTDDRSAVTAGLEALLSVATDAELAEMYDVTADHIRGIDIIRKLIKSLET